MVANYMDVHYTKFEDWVGVKTKNHAYSKYAYDFAIGLPHIFLNTEEILKTKDLKIQCSRLQDLKTAPVICDKNDKIMLRTENLKI